MIEIKYLSVEEIEELYQDELNKNEAINQLVIGNIIYTKKAKAKGIELDPNNSFGVILKDNIVLYFFCNFLPYNMVVTPNGKVNKDDEEECAKALVKDLINNKTNIHGIQSTLGFTNIFINEYPGLFESQMAMDIMICEKVNEFKLKGTIRKANNDDLDELVNMLIGFEKDVFDSKLEKEKAIEIWNIRLADKECDLWLYEIDNKIVGMAGSTRKLPQGRSMGYVYIKDEERNKGYAKEMTSYITKYYLDNGNKYTTLYVDKNNPYSNGAYLKVGYEYLLAVYSYNLKVIN